MESNTEHFTALPQPDRYRIMQAVNTLCANNTDVVAQLEKLAEVKTANGLAWQILKAKVK
jgi:hypothetical protein